MITRRHLVLSGGLAAGGLAAGLAARPLPRPEVPDLAVLCPDRVGKWDRVELGKVVLPPETGLGTAVYEEVLTRRYVTADRPAITLVAAYQGVQTFSAQLHHPDICYPASNFRISAPSSAPFDAISARVPAKTFRARRGERIEDVLYWTRVGAQYPESVWDQRQLIAQALLKGAYLDGVVMRFSVTNASDSNSVAAMQSFAAEFAMALPTELSRLFYGVGG